MTTTTAPTLYETTGSSVKRQYAERADGTWFTRVKAQGRYGTKWTPWTVTTTVPPVAEWRETWDGHELTAGILPAGPYAGAVRLPAK